VLYNFAGGTDSALPGSALALKNGLLYGTASGGTSNYGTVFSLTPPATTGGTWTERVLFDFGGGTNGGYPTNVVFGEGGKLYGATEVGTNSGGTIFELNP
jgi:hypothetical protein